MKNPSQIYIYGISAKISGKCGTKVSQRISKHPYGSHSMLTDLKASQRISKHPNGPQSLQLISKPHKRSQSILMDLKAPNGSQSILTDLKASQKI
ncbi:hypothetical protein PoB_005082100 [Plakobranchus ocellatus]|uniref:Uncharacterized protein n=1 Tax=Plakobranchus ocellatus TaxID=259542 RepID=A0AAV4BYY6_9GAST|nr:hypothetical protein PoB_005082100 [Plakobranchus ocellatus]